METLYYSTDYYHHDNTFTMSDFLENKLLNKTEPLKFDLPTKELEELPEKWCVKTDEQEVVDYCNKNGAQPPYSLSNYCYAHFPRIDKLITTSFIAEKGYTEITFDQFKKWVLKEEDCETEIDWSKAGQFVKSKNEIMITQKHKRENKVVFTGVCVMKLNENGFEVGDFSDDLLKECFKLCTETITLKNE